MNPIEKAIRNALAKGDAGDRTFREAVYRSAFGALDRSIAANPDMTDAIAQRRRQTLLAAITAIETEFVPAKPAPAPTEQQPEVSPPVDAASFDAPPVVAPEPAGHKDAVLAPVLDEDRSRLPRENAPATRRQRRAKPAGQSDDQDSGRGGGRGWSLKSLIGVLVLAAALAAVWWLTASPVAPTTTPSQTGENEPPRLRDDVDVREGWIDIFTPADPTTVAAPGDSRAEVMDDDDGQFLRIRSGASGTPVLFDIGQGVLAQIAGRRAVFSLDVRGADGQNTQIAVDCNLAELGDCGRKRYDAGASREEFLFEVDLPDARAGSGGTIAINPDLEGAGKSLDIYAIRIMPGE